MHNTFDKVSIEYTDQAVRNTTPPEQQQEETLSLLQSKDTGKVYEESEGNWNEVGEKIH